MGYRERVEKFRKHFTPIEEIENPPEELKVHIPSEETSAEETSAEETDS